MRFSGRLIAAIILVWVTIANAAAADTEQISIATLGGTTVEMTAEIADTPPERRRGLMWRDDFAPGDAMLFVFENPRPLYFWMKDTPVSFDIVFFDAAGRWLNTVAGTTPFSTERLPSAGPALYALELAAGEAARLGIGAGSRLALKP